MGAETSSILSEDASTDGKSEKDCFDLPRRLFLSGRYQQCLQVLERQASHYQSPSLQRCSHTINSVLCRSLVKLSSSSCSKTVKDTFLKENDVSSERLKSIPLSLQLQTTYNIAAGYLRMRMPNVAVESCVRCLGGILHVDDIKTGDDWSTALSATNALEILLHRVCVKSGDLRVGASASVDPTTIKIDHMEEHYALVVDDRSILYSKNSSQSNTTWLHLVRILYQCKALDGSKAAHLAAQDEVGGDDLFLSPFTDMGGFLDPINACIETLNGLVFVAKKDFGNAVQAFKKSIACVPGYYPSQWCLSCLSFIIPDHLSLSEKTSYAHDVISSSERGDELHGRLEVGRIYGKQHVVSTKCCDDSQAGLLLQGCLALSNGELNSALTSFREANRRSKNSLLAAYGVAITLRTGGEEGPARDILLKLVEEMEQLSERSSTNCDERLPLNGLCVGINQTVVPATMSQVLWQVTQSSIALADYKMALVYLNRLYNIGQDERSEQIENGLRNIRNSRFFVFYNGPRDPPLSQMVRAKVYTLLQHGKANGALECLESSRGSDVDPALLLYKADALVSLEMDERQEDIVSCTQRAVSILETRHQTFCKKLVEGNGCSAEQSYHHKRQKQMNMNGNDEIALPCARALALAHNNLALVLVLVLWRLGRHKAAAELWLEARGHLPYLSVEHGQQLLQRARQRRAAFLSCNDDACKGNTRDGGGISAIVNGTGEEGCIPASQECALDVMILSFWQHNNGKDESSPPP